VFFNKRKKWNTSVASLLPTFDLTIEIVGPMAALEALDLVYPKGFSAEEGALYLAYLSYILEGEGFKSCKPSKSNRLRGRSLDCRQTR